MSAKNVTTPDEDEPSSSKMGSTEARKRLPKPQMLRANETDAYIGRRICERRLSLGLTQKELADKIGVTYQQVHKYERATNRITVGRLHTAADALDVTVLWFFEGLEEDSSNQDVPLRRRLSLEMMRNVAEIQNEEHLAALNNMVIALSRKTGSES